MEFSVEYEALSIGKIDVSTSTQLYFTKRFEKRTCQLFYKHIKAFFIHISFLLLINFIGIQLNQNVFVQC